MTARVINIRQHVRRVPSRMDTPIHQQLRAEVEAMRASDSIGEMLANAIEEALADVPEWQMDRIRETW